MSSKICLRSYLFLSSPLLTPILTTFISYLDHCSSVLNDLVTHFAPPLFTQRAKSLSVTHCNDETSKPSVQGWQDFLGLPSGSPATLAFASLQPNPFLPDAKHLTCFSLWFGYYSPRDFLAVHLYSVMLQYKCDILQDNFFGITNCCSNSFPSLCSLLSELMTHWVFCLCIYTG